MSEPDDDCSVSVEELIGLCAADCGVKVAAGYPGSPCTKAMETFAREAARRKAHAEWSSNEKVAMEIALGASIAGARSILFIKGVGMNVALDPLMCANLSGVNGGFVIVIGDDPGAWLSQNEQDTRWLSLFADLPLIEPVAARVVPQALSEAFRISEEFALPVFLRVTRSLADARVRRPARTRARTRRRPFRRRNMKHVVVTANAVRYHKALHEKLRRVAEQFEKSSLNRRTGRGRLGVLACGFAAGKLADVLGSPGTSPFRVFNLSTLNPLPERSLARFLRGLRRLVVLEENEPVVELGVRALAGDGEILGKMTGHVPRVGELFRCDIAAVLTGLDRRFRPARDFTPQDDMKPTPTSGGFCEGCPHAASFTALAAAMKRSKLRARPVVCGDPGCLVKGTWEPFKILDVKFAMGGSIGLAAGVVRARPEVRAVAVVGDSSLFHSGLNNLVNLTQNRVPVMILVLDNSTTALTGRQPHPGTGRDLLGRRRPRLPIEKIVKACGVDSVTVVNPHDHQRAVKAMSAALKSNGVDVVVCRAPCRRLASGRKPPEQ